MLLLRQNVYNRIPFEWQEDFEDEHPNHMANLPSQVSGGPN
jgi:hypothetical protein